jgi:hypothetical protein
MQLMSRKRPVLAALTCMVAIGLAACGGSAPVATHKPTPRPSTPAPTPVAPAPKPAPTPPPLPTPLVIQIENSSDARPQSGIFQADIVYEYETEGGISRFSAIWFQPPTVPVGPVRSARLVTVKITQAYDGTLLFSGASAFVLQALQNTGTRSYAEGPAAGGLYRVNSRAAPHNLYTDGAHAQAFLQMVGSHPVSYQLWGRTAITSLPPGGQAVPKFSVPVSDSETPEYVYDPAGGGYQRIEPSTGLLVDADTGAWEPHTIVVLQMPVTVAPEVEDVSGAHGLDFGLQGSGGGQLAVGGRLYSIHWTQGPGGPPQLTLANGQPAPVALGQVLIELVGTGKTVG